MLGVTLLLTLVVARGRSARILGSPPPSHPSLPPPTPPAPCPMRAAFAAPLVFLFGKAHLLQSTTIRDHTRRTKGRYVSIQARQHDALQYTSDTERQRPEAVGESTDSVSSRYSQGGPPLPVARNKWAGGPARVRACTCSSFYSTTPRLHTTHDTV